MAQTLSVNEAQTLISTLLDSVWEAEKPADPTYSKYMTVGSFGRGEDVNYRVAGLGRLSERAELDDIDYDQLEFGEAQTIKPKNWARGFRISEEVVEDLADAGPKDGINVAKLGQYADVTRRWRHSCDWTVDVECTNLFLNGTSTSAEYVLRDGIALYGSHVTLKNPTSTISNRATHASLSASALQLMVTSLDGQLDDRGDYLADGDGDILVVGLLNDFRAYEITKTTGQVDSANNNVNPLQRERLQVVVNKYLGSTHAGYYLLRKGVHSFNWKWRVKPTFAKDTDFDSISMKFRARMRGARFVKGWQGTVGDTGS